MQMCTCKFKRNYFYSSLKMYNHLVISRYTSTHSFHFSKCEHHSRVKYFIYPHNFSNVCSEQPLLCNSHCSMPADADKRRTLYFKHATKYTLLYWFVITYRFSVSEFKYHIYLNIRQFFYKIHHMTNWVCGGGGFAELPYNFIQSYIHTFCECCVCGICHG